MSGFEDLGISAKVLMAIKSMGWDEPTPVQEQTIPVGIQGKDLMAQAQTGTGKTGAYSTIMLSRTGTNSRIPTSLVLCPTRELAMQVQSEVYRLTKFTRHRSMAVYGGASYDSQFRMLSRGIDIVVGTPGRLKDLIEKEMLDLSGVRIVVLDEADIMLDMGFEEEMNFILGNVPEGHQTMLFSATMPDEVMDIAKRHLDEPEEFLISRDEPTVDTVDQYLIYSTRFGKREKLESILECGSHKAMIFCQTKAMVDELNTNLSERFKIGMLHGDMPQAKRERTIRAFRNDRFQALIATDVAARGIDIRNVGLVINYDIPTDPETYIHRIGRTGRAGESGMAVTFVSGRDERYVGYTFGTNRGKIRKISIEKFLALISGSEVKYVPEKRVVKETAKPLADKQVIVMQINLGKADKLNRMQISDYVKITADLSDDIVGRVGLGDTSSYIEVDSTYAEHIAKKVSNTFIEGKRVYIKTAPQKVPYAQKVAEPIKDRDATMVTMQINLGKRDGFDRRGIVEHVRSLSGISGEMIGKARVGESRSYVDIEGSCIGQVESTVNDSEYEGRSIYIRSVTDGSRSDNDVYGPAVTEEPEKKSSRKVTMQINLGRAQEADADSIRSFLLEKTGMSEDAVGQVWVGDTSSMVEVDDDKAENVVNTVCNTMYDTKRVFIRSTEPVEKPEHGSKNRRSGHHGDRPGYGNRGYSDRRERSDRDRRDFRKEGRHSDRRSEGRGPWNNDRNDKKEFRKEGRSFDKHPGDRRDHGSNDRKGYDRGEGRRSERNGYGKRNRDVKYHRP